MLHIQFWDTFSDRQVVIPTNLYQFYDILFQSTLSLGLPSCSLQNSLFASVTERYGIWEGLEAEASFKINCTSAVMVAAIDLFSLGGLFAHYRPRDIP